MDGIYNGSMADLKSKRLLRGNIFLAFIFIVFLIGAGFYFLRDLSLVRRQQENQKRKIEESDRALKEDFVKVVVASPDTKETELVDLSAGELTGTVYVLRRDNNFFLVSQANLLEPDAGYFYEGWLGKDRNDMSLSSLGRLEKIEDFPYILEYATEGEFADYKYFVITKERSEDFLPEKKLMEAVI